MQKFVTTNICQLRIYRFASIWLWIGFCWIAQITANYFYILFNIINIIYLKVFQKWWFPNVVYYRTTLHDKLGDYFLQ